MALMRSTYRPIPATRITRTPTLIALLLTGWLAAGMAPTNADGSNAPPGSFDREGLRAELLARPDFGERLPRIFELELQIASLLNNQPLRLGAVGSALLDLDPASLAANLALAEFYKQLDEGQDAAFYQQRVEQIVAAIEAAGDGSRERPWPVLTATEAMLLAEVRHQRRIGSIYTKDARRPLMLSLTVADESPGARHKQQHFDLSATYNALLAAQPEDERDQFSPGTLIGFLAEQGDPAAQATIGGTLLRSHPEAFERALRYLNDAAGHGNLIAALILAEGHVSAARVVGPEQAQFHLQRAADLYLESISRGSPDAMYELGSLYLEGVFGEDNVVSGLALLRQAADLDHVGAMLRLSGAYLTGEGVDQDTTLGMQLLHRAAESGDRRARIALGRLAVSRTDVDIDKRAIHWLQELGEQDDPEALTVLGNLYAGGHHVRQSSRKARRLYRRAAELTDDPRTINEIAWTLAVSSRKRLRDPGTAVSLMDTMMESQTRAREVPAYLDTWAAAHAASGNFERAIEIQRDAIASAEKRGEDDVLDELRTHLEMFEAGKPVREDVP